MLCRGFGQPEVEQLGAGLRQHDVPGFTSRCTMPCRCAASSACHDLDRTCQCLREWKRAALESRGQGLAFQVFQDEEVDAVLVDDVVHRTDVGMGKCGDRLGLAIESCAKLRIAREARWQNFYSDRPMEARVGREIDLGHAARAEQPLDTVGAHVAPGLEGRVGLEQRGGELRHRSVDQHRRAIVRDERFHLTPQGIVALSRPRQECLAIAGGAFEDRLVQLGDTPPSLRVHAD